MNTGMADRERHVILAFPHPTQQDVQLVIDMTRMQFGAAGRGPNDESYFLGTWEAYQESMKKICNQAEFQKEIFLKPDLEKALEDRLRQAAEIVWERWNNRHKEGWCEYCGKGGPDLLKCSGCKNRNVYFCSAEHQRLGGKLHSLTCGGKET